MTDDASATPSPPPPSDGRSQAATESRPPRRQGRRRRGRGFPRLVKSLWRLADLQYQIWLTRAKLAALKIALFAVLSIAAMVLAVLAIVFLYLGAFRLLTDQLHIPPAYAYLLFGAVHLLLAAILAWIGYRILVRTDDLPPEQPAASSPASPAAANPPPGGEGRPRS